MSTFSPPMCGGAGKPPVYAQANRMHKGVHAARIGDLPSKLETTSIAPGEDANAPVGLDAAMRRALGRESRRLASLRSGMPKALPSFTLFSTAHITLRWRHATQPETASIAGVKKPGVIRDNSWGSRGIPKPNPKPGFRVQAGVGARVNPNDYLVYKSENTVQNTMSSTQPDVNVPIVSRITPHSATILPMSRNRSPSVEAIKDKEAQSFHPPLPLNGPIFVEAYPCSTPITAPVVVKPILRNIINLCTSESESEPIKLEQTPTTPLSSEPAPSKPAGRFPKGAKISITRKEKVDRVVHLSEIPARWPVSNVDTAHILDFSNDSRIKQESDGKKPKGFDEFLKKEDQDSWGKGTNGSASRDTSLTILDGIPCRRSVHTCNGGHKCDFFDPKLLSDYQRRDGEDMSLAREIFAREPLQNQTDSGFFRVVQQYKKRCCTSKSECDGVPVLKRLKAPSNDGKLKFIGCSKWVKTEPWTHTYAVIPADVDESLLAKLLSGSALPPAELEAHDGDGYCARLAHPRHGKKTQCPHIHFRDGVSITAKMILHRCTAQKIVYTSKDPNIPKCVVIFRGLHSHPPWPAEKPGHAAKEDVKRCMDAGGVLGETGGHLNNLRATQAVLGASIDIKHLAFRDTRRLRDEVSKLKSDGTPAGLLWAGILADYEDDLKLPLAKRYVHHVHMSGETKIAVAMNPELAALLHEEGVRFIEGDITFKHTKGEMNEWEAAVWYTPSLERVTVARIYTNACSKEAFTHLFDAFFGTVKKVTGKSVRFKAFDPKGSIYSIHFDMEAAQVQGSVLGFRTWSLKIPHFVHCFHALIRINLSTQQMDLFPSSGRRPLTILIAFGVFPPRWILPTGINFAQHIRIRSFGDRFLTEVPSLDWHAHKVQYPWLLPGYNESLSSFPKGFWQQSPNHTNLVESAHVASNRATKINLLPVEAVRKARIFDAEKAASIAAARETCILVNRRNEDQVRMTRNEHHNVGISILETQAELAALNASKQDAAARLKDLKSQKKELGRVPRHSTSGRTGPSTSIPKIVGTRSDSSDDEESQLQVEPDASSSPAAPTMSSSPFSSPGPILHSEALDETDIDFTSGAYVDSSAVIPPVDEFDGQLMTFTDEELDAFAAFDFNDLMVDARGFEQQWQAVLDAFAPPANEWPTLPAPALPSSPRQESSLPSADTTGAPVPAAVPAPAP
ncbi:hypothetical protein C8J57DRAFT_1576159 [Mycena rebaudengoi]|nr:hypothetical protein C8J57DRAFT_1576159 [Mycena rebaudengoi]